MIVELKQGKVLIHPMKVPEPAHKVYVKYIYEDKTNHLLPRLTIGTHIRMGDDIFIDTTEYVHGELPIKVELLDGTFGVVRTYVGTLQYHKYCIVGAKPIRPDLDEHIHSLNKAIDRLNLRIKELEELGEVI